MCTLLILLGGFVLSHLDVRKLVCHLYFSPLLPSPFYRYRSIELECGGWLVGSAPIIRA